MAPWNLRVSEGRDDTRPCRDRLTRCRDRPWPNWTGPVNETTHLRPVSGESPALSVSGVGDSSVSSERLSPFVIMGNGRRLPDDARDFRRAVAGL